MKAKLAKALATLLSDRQYVVIDQRYPDKLRIEAPSPGKVFCEAEEDHLDVKDSYGIWCSLIPESYDSNRGEFVFRCELPDRHFFRTFKILRPPSSSAWQDVEDTFYHAYKDANKCKTTSQS